MSDATRWVEPAPDKHNGCIARRVVYNGHGKRSGVIHCNRRVVATAVTQYTASDGYMRGGRRVEMKKRPVCRKHLDGFCRRFKVEHDL